MFIAPDTDLYLISNVPLDPTYVNTVVWQSAQDQETWFIDHASHEFHNLSYQRHNSPSVRLELPVEAAMMCNYMLFKNTAFGDKAFYAFITDVSYVSNSVCEIQFELDVMQTYQFDWNLEQCWVEREHAASDGYGEHTLPEPVDFGTPMVDSVQTPINMYDYTLLLNSTWGSS